MNFKDALAAVEAYVTTIFTQHRDERLLYHNLTHTRHVVGHARQIAEHYQLHEGTIFIVCAAAWFHDIGYLFTTADQHEEEGVRQMEQYFNSQQLSTEWREQVATCIRATSRAKSPQTVAEKILCDADSYHFGTREFRATDPLVRREIELLTGKSILNWKANTLAMLKAHVFFTSFCREELDPGVQENIEWLETGD